MDAVIASAVFSYWAYSSSPPIRIVFACCAALILLTEAIVFRKSTSRGVLIISAAAVLYLPLSTTSILPPYSSYVLITGASYIGLEVLVAGTLLSILCLLIIVPLRRRRLRRQIVQPIQTVPLQHTSAPPRPAVPQSAGVLVNRQSSSQTTRAPESAKNFRRPVITRSHALASRLYNQDLERKERFLPQNLVAEREQRRLNERQALIQEANNKMKQAQAQLSKALDVLRNAHRLAESAITTRDEHIRNLDGSVDPNDYDEETEKLFTDARKAEQRKSDALREVTTAQAILGDVERWASEL